jgi:hypothetical protein
MRPGDVLLANLPQADGRTKDRPVLCLRSVPPFGDLLVCGITTQLSNRVEDLDEIVAVKDVDFRTTGLKATSLVRVAFLAVASCMLVSGYALAGPAVKGEPTNDAERAAKKQAADAAVDAKYAALVATLPVEEQAWETVLQENLGSFYLPLHKRDKLAGRSNAWDCVKDAPALPRVLLIGDSVSRGYTQVVRSALAGRANVHRAPANCGPTASGVKNIEAWLGDGRWDVIHFNFGIHDRNTPVADYSARLEKLVERLQATGATLVWASTTPIPDKPEAGQTAVSIVAKNAAAAAVMQKQGIAIDDLFSFIMPHLDDVQPPGDVHFTAAGYDLLGGQVAESILDVLGPRKAD